jgi:lipoprotein-anchoring transpeptidase ErfK/SrfK
MKFRTAGAVAALLIGVTGPGNLATAQYYPAQQVYPAQSYPPVQSYPPYRPAPALEEDDDAPFYDPPMVQRRPLPPIAGAQEGEPLPAAQAARAAPIYPEENVELLPPPPPPPGYSYREGRQGYELSSDPRLGRPVVSPGAAASQGLSQPSDPNAVRPPLAIGPGQTDPAPAGATGGVRMAALPPEVRPETGPAKELPPQFRRTLVDFRTKEPAGTLVVDTQNTYLYLVLGNGKAIRYGIGVGREGFTWNGTEKVSRMAEWPDWHPPEEMIDRQPYLPRFMAGGPGNPLGARALYLGKTVYRIHGTNQPSTIGTFVSSGCIRLTNEDVMDLYGRVKVGTHVVVLPGKAPPTTAAAAPLAPAGAAPAAVRPGAPPIGTAPLPPPTAMAR